MVHQNNKLFYLIRAGLRLVTPKCWLRRQRRKLLDSVATLSAEERQFISDRVNYYCALPECCSLPPDSPQLRAHTLFGKHRLTRHSVYFFDSYEYTRYFPDHLHWQIEEGDVNTEMTSPTITKTRPVMGKEGTSFNTLLNMDKVRHFLFIDDPVQWEDKKGKVLFRGVIYSKENRKRFVEMYGTHPLCDLKDTDKHSPLPDSLKAAKPMSLREHLNYRYIMSLEGNDVASNLKWVMSSNSIAVMPRPTCESWFMEGRLIGNYHYIEIAPDYHDLTEKIQYYESHPEEAKQIVQHAHEWVKQFRNPRREKIISILTLQQYLSQTNKSK